MDDPIWDVTVFTKNRERLLKGDIAQAFFSAGAGIRRKRDRVCCRTSTSPWTDADRSRGQTEELHAARRRGPQRPTIPATRP